MTQTGATLPADGIRIGPWMFDPTLNRLKKDSGETIQLEDRASKVLTHLAAERGQTVGRDALIEAVWRGRALSDNSVAVVISDLRKALGDDVRAAKYIETVPKRGYRLRPEAETPSEAAAPRANTSGAMNGFRAPLLLAAGLAAILVTAAVLWRASSADATTQAANVVVTINNVQNQTGLAEFDALAASITELGAAYLSQSTGEAALVRDRWDFDAEDPSRGLYEDFGENARVYHIATRIIISDGAPLVSMFANNPKTNEVVWATTFPAPDEGLADILEGRLHEFLDQIGAKPSV